MTHKKANAITLRQSMVILGSMVVNNTKRQYRRSVLGVLWTVLNPLLTMLVLNFVFSRVFGRSGGIALDYPIYVMSGNIVFGLMRSATSMALGSFVDNRDLLLKTRVPAWVFPTASVFSATVNFGFSVLALIVVMLFRLKYVQFHWTMLMILVPWLPLILAFCLGLGLLLSCVYVRFRDVRHLYNVFLLLWMYATPIFYTVDQLKMGKSVETVMQVNPMYHFLQYFRSLLLGDIPGWREHLICAAFSGGFLVLGLLMYLWQRKKIVLHF